MSDTPYLIKLARFDRGKDVCTTDELRVRLASKRRMRNTGMKIDGMPVSMSEHAGWDRKRLHIQPIKPISGSGAEANGAAVVERTAAGVKSVLRRMRPDHAAWLHELDHEIERLEALAAAKRAERAEFVQSVAWPRAHVVRLADVEAQLVTPSE